MAVSADISSGISSIIPSGIGSNITTTLIWVSIFILFLIVLVAGGVGVWLIIRSLQYNKKIVIFEERNGHLEQIGKDRAKELKYNYLGDTVFILRKRKKFLPRGEIKMGKNLYYYFIRAADGEWVNFDLQSMNESTSQAGIKFVHPDMRAFRSGLSKIMKDRYEKKSMLKEYLPIILPIIFFLIISVALYFIVDRIVSSQDNLNTMTVAAKEVMIEAKSVIAALANACSNSGVR